MTFEERVNEFRDLHPEVYHGAMLLLMWGWKLYERKKLEGASAATVAKGGK